MFELSYNPYLGAREAYLNWHLNFTIRDWTSWHRKIRRLPITKAEYYQKLSDICVRALGKPALNDDVARHIAYSAGYFQARAKSSFKTEEQAMKGVSPQVADALTE